MPVISCTQELTALSHGVLRIVVVEVIAFGVSACVNRDSMDPRVKMISFGP